MTQTTYILAGGNDRQYSDYGKRLGQEIVKHSARPKILSCFFSQPEDTWVEKTKDWNSWFADNLSQPFSYDYTRQETLLDQIDAADVVYFHGGITDLLLAKLPDAKTMKQHFAGKMIIGSSAGSNMLSRHFWSSSKGIYGEGKGVLDLSVMVHYGATIVGDNQRTTEEWAQQEQTFASMVNMPITHLPEGRYIVIKEETI